MVDPSGPFSLAKDGVRVFLRVTPKASRDKIDGLADEADGGRVLKVAVTAVPEDGKANDAVIKLLSKAWRVPRSHIQVIAGQTSRSKTLLIDGDGAAVLDGLTQWLDGFTSCRR